MIWAGKTAVNEECFDVMSLQALFSLIRRNTGLSCTIGNLWIALRRQDKPAGKSALTMEHLRSGEPPDMKRDPFYKEILKRLQESLDPDCFEAGVCDLLSSEFPSLVPVHGGGDSGMDGAIADGDGPAYPLICTTSSDVIGNLDRNLRSYLEDGGRRRKAVVATSQSLSALRKKNLERKAEGLGFDLVQIFDRRAIADRLYRSPKWCLELLNLTGDAPTLSPVPRTTRPLTEHELIGRDDDLSWLREAETDSILIGQPGSGKTILLHRMAQEGKGLFIVGDDLSHVAREVREKNPGCLFLDDAHVDPQRLVRLVQMRRDLDMGFKIVASTWPGGCDEVIGALGVSGTRRRTLGLLTRNQIVQVLRSLGLLGPNHLIRELVDQARGLPGLAVTLASLCRHDGVQEVALGTALKRSINVTLKSLVGDLAIEVLSCFALGGDAGMSWEVIAKFLDMNPLVLRRVVAGLEASGVITDLGDKNLSVHPVALRHALLRDMFFSGPVSLDPEPLMQHARSAGGIAESLIGAKAAGASLDGNYLWSWVERANTEEVWVRYAWLGPKEVRTVLERRPDRLISVASAGLHQAPESILTRLFAEAIGDPRDLGSNPSHPLRLTQDWIHQAEPGSGEPLRRRKILLEQALNWLNGGGDVSTGLRAYKLAFSPRFEWSETDPGAGRLCTLTYGFLEPEELEDLGNLWTENFDSLPWPGDGAWRNYIDLANEWIYPSFRQGPETDRHLLILATMKKVAPRFVAALIGVAGGRPGILQTLNGCINALGMEHIVSLDPEYEVVFPGRHRHGGDWEIVEARHSEAATKLGELWASSNPEAVVARLAYLTREALLLGHPYPDYSLTICHVIASGTDVPLDWIRAFERIDGLAEQVDPFFRRLASTQSQSWPEVAEEFLSHPSWMPVVLRLVLSNEASPLHLLDSVLGKLDSRWSDFIWTMALRSELPEPSLRSLLEHQDPSVAGSAAVGEWIAGSHGTVRESLKVSWREAIVRTSAHEYHLAEILQADPSLAHEWLVHHFPRILAKFDYDDPLVIAATSQLSRELRTHLLNLMQNDHCNDWLISVVVGDDLELYRSFLEIPSWKEKHLMPLLWSARRMVVDEKPDLDSTWVKKAQAAMDAGYSPEEVARIKLLSPRTWCGEESLMWQTWEEAFRNLGEQDNPLVHRLAVAGTNLASAQKQRALDQERIEAIHGRW